MSGLSLSLFFFAFVLIGPIVSLIKNLQSCLWMTNFWKILFQRCIPYIKYVCGWYCISHDTYCTLFYTNHIYIYIYIYIYYINITILLVIFCFVPFPGLRISYMKNEFSRSYNLFIFQYFTVNLQTDFCFWIHQ